jgi:hypothetical protein
MLSCQCPSTPRNATWASASFGCWFLRSNLPDSNVVNLFTLCLHRGWPFCPFSWRSLQPSELEIEKWKDSEIWKDQRLEWFERQMNNEWWIDSVTTVVLLIWTLNQGHYCCCCRARNLWGISRNLRTAYNFRASVVAKPGTSRDYPRTSELHAISELWHLIPLSTEFYHNVSKPIALESI